MGMFDYVYFVCPACGTEIELQSKMGPCDMKRFHVNRAPLSVTADVAEGGPYECDKCGAMWRVDVLWMTSILRAAIQPTKAPKIAPSQLMQLEGVAVPQPLMTELEAANFLQIQPKTLQRWRMQGVGPKCVKIGKKNIRYKMDDLMEWVDKPRSDTTE